MYEILNRKQAISKGVRHFYTGQPCKHGHLARRYTTNGGCVECVNPKLRSPGSGMKWLELKIALAEGLTVPQERVAELETLIRGWAEYKLREWGFIVPVAFHNHKAGDSRDVDGEWSVFGADGQWHASTRETVHADIERERALAAQNAG
jgi:hypothetical protein